MAANDHLDDFIKYGGPFLTSEVLVHAIPSLDSERFHTSVGSRRRTGVAESGCLSSEHTTRCTDGFRQG